MLNLTRLYSVPLALMMIGLFHDRPVTFARIAGGALTWISMLISMINIVINQWAG